MKWYQYVIGFIITLIFLGAICGYPIYDAYKNGDALPLLVLGGFVLFILTVLLSANKKDKGEN